MMDLINIVSVRLAGLLAGEQFDMPGGDSGIVDILPLGVQSKDVENETPFIVVRLTDGKESGGSSYINVELVGQIYVSPDGSEDLTVPAMDDMERMIAVYRGLAIDGNYHPYSLESMTWRLGDAQSGLHPGPDYYEVSAVMQFQAAPIF